MNPNTKNLLLFILLQIFIAVILVVVNNQFLNSNQPSFYTTKLNYIIIFFSTLTTFAHQFLLSKLGNVRQFVPLFMASIGVKLFSTLGLMIVYALFAKVGIRGFIINCAFAYFLYTSAHLSLILWQTRQQN